MTPRIQQTNTDVPHKGAIMAMAVLAGAKTARKAPAKRADTVSRPNILVSRRRRSARRDAR